MDERPSLERPVLVAAFRGWNDGAQGASLAVGYLAHAPHDQRHEEPATARRRFFGYFNLFVAAMLLLAPNVNSYRRLRRHSDAPINLHWGWENRTVGLRVPDSTGAARRVENRVAGADANPYLAIAASLTCGYLGMTERLKPRQPVEGSAYRLAFTLPRTLYDALYRWCRDATGETHNWPAAQGKA